MDIPGSTSISLCMILSGGLLVELAGSQGLCDRLRVKCVTCSTRDDHLLRMQLCRCLKQGEYWKHVLTVH